MAHGAILLTEGNAVLLVVGAVLHHAANVDELFQQFEVLRIARFAIELGHAHVVRGADGVAGQLLGSTLTEVIEEVGSTDTAVEERRLASGPFVDNAGHDEMAEVVGLEVEAVLEGFVILFPNSSAYRALSCLLQLSCTRLNGVSLLDDDGRMDVAVGALRLLHKADETVHNDVELGVVRHGIDGGDGLQPFVHVAVMERRAVVLALCLACCHEEVVKSLSLLRLPSLPHALYAGLAQHAEALAPKAACPLH